MRPVFVLHQVLYQKNGFDDGAQGFAQAPAFVTQTLVCVSFGEPETLLQDPLGTLSQLANFQLLPDLERLLLQPRMIGCQL